MAKQPKGRAVSGILILDKPTGMSSNHALQRVKRIFGARKAGHTGALDPLATGLLPICLGEATKFTQFLLDANKRYQTSAQLGVRTDSSDADGEVIETKPCEHITQARVEAELPQFRGNISQVPSMFSALKHQGQPLYKLARAGKQVAVKPRQVEVFDLTLLAMQGSQVAMDITCSKGTYIRSIVEDLGLALGCGAHVAELRRLQAGPFVAEQMVTLEQLHELVESVQQEYAGKAPAKAQFAALDKLLLPLDTAVLHLNAVQLAPQQSGALQQGKIVTLDEQQVMPGIVRVYTSQAVSAESFIGLAEVTKDGVLRAKRLLQTQPQAD
ncbi:MAG TPA: tRNA pseudouridine(55) synthase TruB [Oceanospirillaceae bacterium]|nr:tRNA pseudouridine(55) synthase TruB [Oceanospirillaceae bacterium]